MQRLEAAMEQAQASRSAQLKAERTTTELQIKLDRRQQHLGVSLLTRTSVCERA